MDQFGSSMGSDLFGGHELKRAEKVLKVVFALPT